MDTSNVLKRPRLDEYSKCIICQETSNDTLERKEHQSVVKLKDRAKDGLKYCDFPSYESIDRIEKVPVSETVMCRRKCYSCFTHTKSIEALRKKYNKDSSIDQKTYNQPKAGPSKMSSSVTKTRRSVDPIIWDLCIFCQSPSKNRTPLFNVTTFRREYIHFNKFVIPVCQHTEIGQYKQRRNDGIGLIRLSEWARIVERMSAKE